MPEKKTKVRKPSKAKRTVKSSPRKQQKGNELLEIFNAIRPLMKKYEPPFTARADYEARYDLWSEKELVIAGRKRKDVYFAGLIIQSNYVGFYYMPVYSSPDMKKFFKPELLSTLKGKSCFHIRTIDKKLIRQIKEALEKGYKLYKQRGWV